MRNPRPHRQANADDLADLVGNATRNLLHLNPPGDEGEPLRSAALPEPEPLASEPAPPQDSPKGGRVRQERAALLILTPKLSDPWAALAMAPLLMGLSAKLIGMNDPNIWITYMISSGLLGVSGVVFSINMQNPRVFGLAFQFLILSTAAPAFVSFLLQFARSGGG